MSLNADGFQGLELVRHQGIFEFAGLSGGTKEQLAAAVPLAIAIAELLAATRGLQIIILTCTPSDYDTLGATEIVLQPVTISSATTSDSAPSLPPPHSPPILAPSDFPDS